MSAHNRRKGKRIPFAHACRMQSGKNIFRGMAENISINGVGLILNKPCSLIMGTCVRLDIHLKTKSAEMTVSVKSQVAWNDGKKKVGLQFLELEDSDLGRIRRIIEVNKSRPDELRNDLEFLIQPFDIRKDKEE